MHPSVRLKELEQRARKRFGQNFLTQPEMAARIVQAAGVRPGDKVLEIGPGLGVLTEQLRNAGAELVCVELDRDLAAALREWWPDLRLVEGDALKVDLAEVCPGSGWKVVANLPYNVGTHILMRLLSQPERFSTLTLMFQREVGDRLQAGPDDDAVGALSIQVQARAEVSRLVSLPPGAFHPPPKVHSVVLGFRLLPSPDFGGVPPATFDRVVRLGYAQRRKTLYNALGAGIGKERAGAALAEAGIDPRRRAETLSLDDWRRLALAVTRGGEALPEPPALE